MQKKSLETILYSSVGIVVMLVILVAVNVITGAVPFRADMTQEKAYTLSPGTKAVLKKLDTPVKIRFYCTQGGAATPETVYLKDYARTVADLLNEYKQVAGKNLIIQKLDPQPDSDAEDSAQMDGLQGQPLPGGDSFYLGLSINEADQRVAIPFLDPSRERSLEYDITRAITQVLVTEKPVVGVMSSLPVFGGPANPMMAQMDPSQQPPSAPAWTVVEQLKQDFTLRSVPLDTQKIDDDVKVLLVIHPQGISDQTQYAIDQFVMRGGKLIAFLDPVSAIATRQQQNPEMGGMGGQQGPSSSSVDKLIKAWGLQFDTSKVVADLDFKMQLQGPNGQPQDAPTWLGLNADGINTNDIVTSEMDNIWLPMAGAFTGTPVAGLKETVLLHSSKDAELIDGFMATMGGDVMRGFTPVGTNYALAIRLTGTFKTAFPNGKPADASNTNQVAAGGTSLKQTTAENSVVLVGDSDMIADDFSLRKTESPFGTIVNPMNANLDFAQNVVEQMAGDNDLIGVRSRASLSRPFTRIKKMEAAAEASGEAKIQDLQQSLSDAQQRLSELQQAKTDKDQRTILSPEQKAEIDNFRKKQAEVQVELRQAQKDLRKEVVSLENRLTWINILAVPLAVTLAGVAMALVKRKKTAAA
jgi:ABC-type uncharacterized transport system involved in gliding motility auxiliary subunit